MTRYFSTRAGVAGRITQSDAKFGLGHRWGLRWWLLLGAGLASLSACNETPSSGPREQLCALSGCSRECRELEVSVCDIRDRACQELVFQSVRCVRGSSLTQLPPTNFVDQKDFGDPDAALGPEDAGVVAELPPEVVAGSVWDKYLDEGLQLLHLIDKPLVVARAEEGKATGGVTQGNNVAIAENNADQLWWSMRLLAHEYVHTMQEHDYGGIGSLYARYTRSSVTAQGVQAFIEGEAELYAWLAHAFMRNQSVDDWNLEDFFDLDQKAVRSRVAGTDSPWTTARQWQHYAIGARYLYKTWRRSKNIGVRSVMYNLDPNFGAWAADFAPRTGPEIRERDVCEPAGNHTIVQDSLGPSGVFAILMAASRTIDAEVVPTEYAWRIATELTEDVMRMYAPTYGGAISQAEWMERDAKLAMCKPLGADSKTSVRSSVVDGGSGEAGTSFVLDVADAALHDAATNTGSDPWGPSTASAATATDSTATVDTATVDTAKDSTETDSRSEQGVVCDAGYVGALVMNDAGTFPVSSDTPFADLQQHLIPGAATWVRWAFAFETKDSAMAFAEWISDANWPTLRVEQQGQRVSLRSRRTPTTDAERTAFEAWTCK